MYLHNPPLIHTRFTPAKRIFQISYIHYSSGDLYIPVLVGNGNGNNKTCNQGYSVRPM